VFGQTRAVLLELRIQPFEKEGIALTRSHRIIGSVCALAALWVAPAFAQEKNAVTVESFVIKRGTAAFTVRAIAAPEIGKPGTTREQVSRAMNLIAASGGNAISFDLYGIAEDGSSISAEAAEAARQVNAIGADRGVLSIIHLTGEGAPKSEEARLAWARTAAKTFTRDSAYVYYIDGEDAGKLTRAFKRVSKHLTVVSSKYADIDVVVPGEKSRKKPQLLFGAVPKELTENAHFLLAADQASYAALEKASALPEEAKGWTPDNASLSPEDRAAGFVALFDGKTFNGWTVLGAKKDAWVIKDGVLSRESGGSQGLRTVRRFTNFDMKWEWNLPKGGNNGVHFRAPRAQRASRVGFEYQMLGDYGKEPDKNSTGSIYDVVPPTVNASKPQGEWNQSEAIFDGTHITYYLNGQKVNDVDMNDIEELRPRLREGFIVLTEHSDPVMYRNICIKELP
jgi:hypothetical protein